jgi:hypothetical protein
MKLDSWDYYGDGVYAKPDQYGIWLHANDHKNPTDKIYLEWYVYDSLTKAINQLMNISEKEVK